MKNPWMSLWLTEANRAAGTARAFWTAEAQRQQKAMTKAMTEAMTDALTRAWTPGAATRKRRSK